MFQNALYRQAITGSSAQVVPVSNIVYLPTILAELEALICSAPPPISTIAPPPISTIAPPQICLIPLFAQNTQFAGYPDIVFLVETSELITTLIPEVG